MFVFAAGVILLCAEPFAEALVETGADLGISEFLLVQWLAPLASEAPELLVAGLYAWRLNTNAGLGTLVSSKVNQWTLLVGTLPIVFSIAAGGLHGLPIEAVQREELFLTAAQSFFALAVLSNLSMSLREAWFLFGLFWAQFVLGAIVPESLHGVERIAVGCVYMVLGLWIFIGDRQRMPRLLRDGFRTPYAELAEADRSRRTRPASIAPVDPRAFLASLTADEEAARSLVHVRELPARRPQVSPFPGLDPAARAGPAGAGGRARALPAPGGRARGARGRPEPGHGHGHRERQDARVQPGVRGRGRRTSQRRPRSTSSPRKPLRGTSSGPFAR